jgi:hypothetical protein
MSDYTKLTAYDTKDALPTGDPLKRIKGTELDDEFDAISTAVATKADKTSPTFTGTSTFANISATGTITSSGAATFPSVTTDSITFEGATADAYETTLVVTDPTADRTITIPNKTGTLALTSEIATQATINSAQTGTYSIAGTTMTVNITSHGYAVDDLIVVDFTSGTAVDGRFTVVTASTNSFTLTYGSSLTTSGNVSVQKYTVGTLAVSTNAESVIGTATNTAVTPASLKHTLSNAFPWTVTYVNTAVTSGNSYTLPSKCIGVYIWCTVYGGSSNGAIGQGVIKDSAGSTLGTVYINGTNLNTGADGGSGMTDGAGSFIPVSSAATTILLSGTSGSATPSFTVQAYVTV